MLKDSKISIPFIAQSTEASIQFDLVQQMTNVNTFVYIIVKSYNGKNLSQPQGIHYVPAKVKHIQDEGFAQMATTFKTITNQRSDIAAWLKDSQDGKTDLNWYLLHMFERLEREDTNHLDWYAMQIRVNPLKLDANHLNHFKSRYVPKFKTAVIHTK